MKKTLKRIGNIVCIILLIAMLALVVVLFTNRSQNKVTFFFDKATVWIVSHSMEPMIEEHSYIQVQKIDAHQVNVGDVIMFYSDDPQLAGQLNTHRVEEIIGDHEEFVTKGINNPIKDAYTAKADKVVGVYVKSMPILTALMRFFLSEVGFFLIVLVFIGITLALCLPDILRYFRAKRQKKEEDLALERERLIALEVERLKREASEHPNQDSQNENQQ